ncbi:lantibiotic dehydratase family protein [Streptomyces uncialis]|uniref:lantibiotic dehydratase n=1 Tax=Streptomyces uncialis TaxID=1048205 RepID=UPI002E310AFD|nr:lantibiotic dehydratase [Streptomyces uncialis]
MNHAPAVAAPLRWTVPHGPAELAVELLSPCLLRTPGFPVALLAGTASPATLDLAARAAARARVARAARADFLTGRWPALRAAARPADAARHPAWRALLRAHRRIEGYEALGEPQLAALESVGGTRTRIWAESWNARVRSDAAFRAGAAAQLRSATVAAWRHTARTVDDERMRHAVFVSNPSFFRTALERPLGPRLDAWDVPDRDTEAVPPRGLRRTLTTAHRYLRRFTTRCETISFFGPVLFAALDGESDRAVVRGEPGAERVLVEASTWLTDALGRAVTERLDPALRVARRSPLFRERDGGGGGSSDHGHGVGGVLERVVDGKAFRVAAGPLALWRAADGTLTLGALAELLGLDIAAADTAARALGPALIVAGRPLPATELRPLARLAPHDPTGTAARLAAARTAYATEPWPGRTAAYERVQERAAELTGVVRRGAGEHYADREVVFEDRTSPWSERVTFGAPVLDGMRRALSAVLPVCHLGALLAREDAREVVRRATGGTGKPLARLATTELPDERPRTELLRTALRDLVAERTACDGVVELTAEEIGAATAGLWRLVPEADRYEASLPSPDLMAVGRDPGSATWLLSELHDDASSVYGGLENRAHSDPACLWEEFTARIAGRLPPEGLATIVSRRRSAHVTPELPGLSVELSGLSGKPRTETAPVAEVSVAPAGDAIEVRGERRLLYPGDLRSPLHRAVSLPSVVPVTVETGARTPRIVIDSVVYQRARWRVPLPDAPGPEPYDRWLAVQRWRSGHSLPRHVFLRHASEPKPLYVDFADPLSVAEVAGLGGGECVVSEMLPAPDELWWESDGGAQCAEFRLGCVVGARR